jgi:hypothetical protein
MPGSFKAFDSKGSERISRGLGLTGGLHDKRGLGGFRMCTKLPAIGVVDRFAVQAKSESLPQSDQSGSKAPVRAIGRLDSTWGTRTACVVPPHAIKTENKDI